MSWLKKKKAPTNDDQRLMSELALRAVHDAVIILDSANNVVLINPAACTLLGTTRDVALTLNYFSIVNLVNKQGSAIDPAQNPITIALSTNQYSEIRDYSIMAAGSNKIIPVSIIITPTGGSADPKIVTIRDITRELQEEEERTEFISTASHEMRTPVASIEGYLALAMNPQTATIDVRAATYLGKAHEASQHLGRLFQDLLDTTKLNDSKIKLRLQPVEMTALVHSIAESQLPIITNKGLKFNFDANAQTQSTNSKRINQLIYAQVDVDFLREIIGNVIENAVKYTPSGSISASVTADQDTVKIIIADTGIGIAREELSHIFQKFYRIDNSDTREIGGTGLGLHISKQRAEAMGGRIWAESELGKGTTFFITFPRLSTDEYEKRRLVMSNQMMTPKTI
ncbi:MAG: PAS domain-containing protein [Candidatus Nomurabacteria bacterium]|jgi:signal transduction histidine kinase|nr:PAS domain-containing protein [Candidatus Nomurabacteria bacterium]